MQLRQGPGCWLELCRNCHSGFWDPLSSPSRGTQARGFWPSKTLLFKLSVSYSHLFHKVPLATQGQRKWDYGDAWGTEPTSWAEARWLG